MQRYVVFGKIVEFYFYAFFLGGSLIDCLNNQIEPETVLKVFYQAVQAVRHLHSQDKPITHRDIKVCLTFFLRAWAFGNVIFFCLIGGKFSIG